MPDLDTRIAEIAGRAEAATEGPWRVAESKELLTVETRARFICEVGLPDAHLAREEAAFIANAREDIPFLLAALQQTREALEFYAERRNYRPAAGSEPDFQPTVGGWMEVADSFDGNGPGARARAALAPEQTKGAAR